MNKTILITVCIAISCVACRNSPPFIYHFTPPSEDIRHILVSHLDESNLNFNPQTVHLVDFHTKTGNYLFRGNIPLLNDSFAYEPLITTFKSIAKKKLHRMVADDVFLIDISLINNAVEKKELEQEEFFFNAHPEKGMLINHPVYGALTSPNSYSEDNRRHLEKIPDIGNINKLIATIKILLDTRKNKPLIIYVHCTAGYDRTGEAIAAYNMEYSGLSYQCAYSNANKIAGRLISQYNHSGIQWHAYYLKDVRGLDNIGDIK